MGLGQLILDLAAAEKPVGLQVNHVSWKLRCVLKVSFEIIYLNVKGVYDTNWGLTVVGMT